MLLEKPREVMLVGCLCGGESWPFTARWCCGSAPELRSPAALCCSPRHASLHTTACVLHSAPCTCPLILAPALIPGPISAPALPQKRLQRRDGTMMTLAQSKRASELQKDMNAWEENRLMTSGGAGQSPSALWW